MFLASVKHTSESHALILLLLLLLLIIIIAAAVISHVVAHVLHLIAAAQDGQLSRDCPASSPLLRTRVPLPRSGAAPPPAAAQHLCLTTASPPPPPLIQLKLIESNCAASFDAASCAAAAAAHQTQPHSLPAPLLAATQRLLRIPSSPSLPIQITGFVESFAQVERLIQPSRPNRLTPLQHFLSILSQVSASATSSHPRRDANTAAAAAAAVVAAAAAVVVASACKNGQAGRIAATEAIAKQRAAVAMPMHDFIAAAAAAAAAADSAALDATSISIYFEQVQEFCRWQLR